MKLLEELNDQCSICRHKKCDNHKKKVFLNKKEYNLCEEWINITVNYYFSNEYDKVNRSKKIYLINILKLLINLYLICAEKQMTQNKYCYQFNVLKNFEEYFVKTHSSKIKLARADIEKYYLYLKKLNKTEYSINRQMEVIFSFLSFGEFTGYFDEVIWLEKNK